MLESLEKGGRTRKKSKSINDYVGTPEFSQDGVVHEAVEAEIGMPNFQRRFRMGPNLFTRMLHDIQDPGTGHEAFDKGLDTLGESGPSALQKLIDVMQIMEYGVSFGAFHEYTGVTKLVAREFCSVFATGYMFAMGGHI